MLLCIMVSPIIIPNSNISTNSIAIDVLYHGTITSQLMWYIPMKSRCLSILSPLQNRQRTLPRLDEGSCSTAQHLRATDSNVFSPPRTASDHRCLGSPQIIFVSQLIFETRVIVRCDSLGLLNSECQTKLRSFKPKPSPGQNRNIKEP